MEDSLPVWGEGPYQLSTGISFGETMWEDMSHFEREHLACLLAQQEVVVIPGVISVSLDPFQRLIKIESPGDDAAVAITNKTCTTESGDTFRCVNQILKRLSTLSSLDGGMIRGGRLGCFPS